MLARCLQETETRLGEAGADSIREEPTDQVKIHLRTISSEERLISGTDIEAECGVMVPKAIFAFSFDLQYADVASLNRVTTCADCYAISKPTGVMYGLVNGQEAITVDE